MAEIYEIEHEGEIWEVEANSIDEAVAAFAPQRPKKQERELPQTPEAPNREATDRRGWVQRTAEGVIGGAIAAGSVAGQALGEVSAGLTGLGTLGISTLSGRQHPMEDAANAIEAVRGSTQNMFGLELGQPKKDMIAAQEMSVGPGQSKIKAGGLVSLHNATEDARNAFRAIGEAANVLLGTEAGKAVVDFVNTADEANLKVFGPAGAALVKTTILGIPEIMGRPTVGLVKAGAKPGLRGGLVDTGLNPKVAWRRHKYNRELEKAMEDAEKIVADLGINLSSDEFAPSVVQSAWKRPGASASRGEGLSEVQTAVRDVAKKRQEIGDKLYEAARAKKAKVDVQGLPALASDLRRKMWEDGVPNVNEGAIADTLGELEDLGGFLGLTPEVGANLTHVSFNAMNTLRKRISKRIKSAGADDATAKALGDIKRGLDSYMDDRVAKGLIRGDPSAARAWKMARMHTARTKATFKDDKLIRDLVMNDATEKQLLGSLLGIGEMGMHKNAASIYKRLQHILGKDAPSLNNMRTSVISDIYAPLLADPPKFSLFINRLENKFKRGNKELIEAMDIDMNELDIMARAAKAANAVQGVSKGTNVDKSFIAKSIGRLMFGHQIAKAGVRVNLANLFIEQLMGAHKMTDRAILKHLMDVDARMAQSPFLPPDHPKFADVMIFGAAADARTKNDEED